LLSQRESVRGDVALDGVAHLWTGPKVSIRRHVPIERLVRTLEVVTLYEELQPTETVCKVREDRPRQKFVPQRFPEALYLPQRLRMLRSAPHVRDALAPQLPRKLALPAPHRVLTTIVGEDFPRRSIRSDAAQERLHHQIRLLVVRHRPAHDEARVVVHEGRQVQPLMTPQQELKDVALPELVRLRPLEAARRRLRLRQLRRRVCEQPFRVQDAPHRRLRDAQRLEARQCISNLPRTHFRVGLLRADHGGPLRFARGGTAARRRSGLLRPQRVRPALAKLPHPKVHRHVPEPECVRNSVDARATFDDCLHYSQPELVRISSSSVALWLCCSSSLPRHLSTLSEWRALGHFTAIAQLINWAAGQRG
jgi:hypothetical protein